MYIVYKHTFKSTNKSYIGYTCKDIVSRLNAHYKLTKSGSDTHFHRAIRKYGLCDIVSTVLWSGDKKLDAKNKEMYYIQKYSTLCEGYNMTCGGDGGWCVPDEKYESWLNTMIDNSTGSNNPRYSGFTDDDLLTLAHEYFIENEYYYARWVRYSSEKFNTPKAFSKFRFSDYNGWGGKRFQQAYCDKYGVDINIFKYKKTEDHNRKISETFTGCRWMNNDTIKKQVMKKDIEKMKKQGWEFGLNVKNK